MDFHCHIDLYPNARDVYAEALRRNAFTLLVTTSPRAFAATSKVLPSTERLLVCPGLHPEIAESKAAERELLMQQIDQCSVVGEVGLDGSPRYRSSFGLQRDILKDVVKRSAQAGGRTLSLHSRRAVSEVLDLLEVEPTFGTAILHWFSGTTRELKRASELGCWFSVGPVMLSSESGRRLAEQMPRSRVVPESDGPFAKIESRPVMPWEAASVSEGLASCWRLPIEDVRHQLHANSLTLIRMLLPVVAE